MKVHIIRFLNGETCELRQLDDRTFACPICGASWPFPPYITNDNVLCDKNEISTPSFGDVCTDCGVEFGVDEGCAPYAPIGFMRRQYIRFRTRWLDRVAWSPQALKQLRDHLGVAEQQARLEAKEVGGECEP